MKNPVFEHAAQAAQSDETVASIGPGEVLIANLVAFDEQGKPMVFHPLFDSEKPISAITTHALSHQYIGRQVALMFVDGNLAQPIIVGLIHSPLYTLLENMSAAASNPETANPLIKNCEATEEPATEDSVDPDSVVFESPLPARAPTADTEGVLHVDGKKVVIEGHDEITFSCGQASITLTKAGKILLRGTYLQSRSSGVNRILGGSVQVN